MGPHCGMSLQGGVDCPAPFGTWGAIHERVYDRYRAYAGRTPKFTTRRLFTKPVVHTKFVQLLSIECKFYDRGEAVVRIA